MTALTELPEGAACAALSSDAVDALGVLREDATFVREQRAAAWAAYERIPMPSSRDEKWRFTNLRRVKLDVVPAFSPAAEEDAVAAACGRAPVGNEHALAQLLHVNGTTVSENLLADTPLPSGAIFCSLERALVEHAELVQQHWGSAVPVTDSVDDKFVALQGATFSNGVFLYVPRNVRIDAPLLANVVHAGAGSHVSWRSLIVLEDGAEAHFVEQFLSAADDVAGFSNAVVELVVGQNAKLTYITAQDYAVPMTHFATHRVLAQRDSQVEWTAVGLGASLGKSRMEARLLGPGANVRLNGAYVLDGRQELDYDTQQFHEAPNAFSDLSFKGVLSDRAKSVWRGMIVVHEGAQGTDSYQENRNLMLSKGAHADSIPGLTIEANDVRCTHGATLSRVDQEQLFYLQSRGISRAEATATIVRGFLTPLLDRVHPEATRDQIREALWARIERSTGTAAAN